jgi:crotonobetainyl-CoA:carnitine CoA-transferase CaiB-like acyl-CoA transferase
VFEDPQIEARNMKVEMDHPLLDQKVSLIGNPIKLSDTPVTYQRPPPLLGQHNGEVLSTILNYSDNQIEELKTQNVV